MPLKLPSYGFYHPKRLGRSSRLLVGQAQNKALQQCLGVWHTERPNGGLPEAGLLRAMVTCAVRLGDLPRPGKVLGGGTAGVTAGAVKAERTVVSERWNRNNSR